LDSVFGTIFFDRFTYAATIVSGSNFDIQENEFSEGGAFLITSSGTFSIEGPIFSKNNPTNRFGGTIKNNF